MRPVRFIAGLITISFLFACGEAPQKEIIVLVDHEEAGVLSSSLTEGSAEAVGLLNFLNDESTGYDVLDIDARLDKRSASGLIHHRNGPDGVVGTWDDNRFDSVEEVDAVKWVGARTIDRMINFAFDHGWIPNAEQLLGVYDGVSFSVNQAEAVLDIVNQLSLDELDVYLNRRAAQNIVLARPLVSIEALSSVRYVGGYALTTLKGLAGKPKAALAQQD